MNSTGSYVPSAHTCSGRTTERCPACGHEDTRDGFECWIGTADRKGPIRFAVLCPKCEAEHPDQSDHDEGGCDGCTEEGVYD